MHINAAETSKQVIENARMLDGKKVSMQKSFNSKFPQNKAQQTFLQANMHTLVSVKNKM